MPFYRRLQEATDIESGRIQFIVSSSEPEGDVATYLKSHALDAKLFADATAVGIKTRATPTLALVNADSSVRSVWVGRLTADQERQVMKAIGDLVASSRSGPAPAGV